MKKYFIYELKKNALAIAVISIFCTAIYLVSVMSSRLTIFEYEDGLQYIPGSLVAAPIVLLCIIVFFAPMLALGFKTQRRDVDCFFSMPITRRRLYLVRAAVGLIATLVPYTISYWLGFLATVVRYDFFAYVYFVPLYFASIPIAVSMFGIIAFAFTRANHALDGTLFAIMYICVGTVVMGYFNSCFRANGYDMYTDYSYWFVYSPITILTSKYSELISKQDVATDYHLLVHVIWGIIGIAAWAGLILMAKNEKAENACRVSDSLLGYRSLIPIYLTFSLALSFPIGNSAFILVAIWIILAATLFMLFRRSIKLKPADLISIGASIVVGIILALFL